MNHLFQALSERVDAWRTARYDCEAVELACEHLGISRTRTAPFFHGTCGQMLAKIIPLNHPLTPLDLEALRSELKNRPEEERDLLVVSLGQETRRANGSRTTTTTDPSTKST